MRKDMSLPDDGFIEVQEKKDDGRFVRIAIPTSVVEWRARVVVQEKLSHGGYSPLGIQRSALPV